jgi:hypothetical protein
MRDGWLNMEQGLTLVLEIEDALVGMGEVIILPSPCFIFEYCEDCCAHKNKNYCVLFEGYIPVETRANNYKYYAQRRENCITTFGGASSRRHGAFTK